MEELGSIVIICYVVGEIFKGIMKKKTKVYKIIPMIVGIIGGILGLVMYQVGILKATNIFDSIGIGIISGLGSTGSHEIIKQIIKEKENGK